MKCNKSCGLSFTYFRIYRENINSETEENIIQPVLSGTVLIVSQYNSRTKSDKENYTVINMGQLLALFYVIVLWSIVWDSDPKR